MTTRTRSRALSVFASLAIGVVGATPALAQPSKDTTTTLPVRDKAADADLDVARALSRAFNRAAAAVEPAVVHITQIRDVPVRRGWEIDTQPMAVGAGSGVILSADGYVLTNNHVIEGARAVRVKLADGRELDGTVVGSDPATDLGVVRLSATDLPTAEWGSDDELYVGEWVLAIGSPFGQFDNTVTSGIISAKNRTGLAGPRDERFEDFIQTDAAINPGNSGGPLVNLEGKVVGINSQIATRSGGNVGIGFSIPASIARPVMDMIIRNNGRVERGWIGVAMAEAPGANGQRGVLLARVIPGGPASKAGLREGDVLVRFNGREMDSPNRLRNAIAFTPPGTDARIELIRNGDPITTAVSIVDTTQGRSILPGGRGVARYGFTVENLARGSLRRLDNDAVIVNYISRLSPAGESGLLIGDVVLRVNGTAVESADEFDKLIRGEKTERLRLDVYRPSTGQRGYINVEQGGAARPAD